MINQFDPIQIRQAVKNRLSIDITEENSISLAKFAELLLKWNKSYNLTSLNSPEDVINLHLIDSLTLVQHFDELVPGAQAVLDVGSGGGLPAIPLAIMRPDLQITMVDAVQKKIVFLRQCAVVCRLKNARAEHSRIEKLNEAPVDVITSRAFASLVDMVSWTRHMLKPQGRWLAMKGKYPEEELAALPKDVVVEKVLSLDLLDGKYERHLVVLKQV